MKTKEIEWDSENSILAVAYCNHVRIGHTVILFSRFGGKENYECVTVFSEKKYTAKTESKARAWVESQFHNFIKDTTE